MKVKKPKILNGSSKARWHLGWLNDQNAKICIYYIYKQEIFGITPIVDAYEYLSCPPPSFIPKKEVPFISHLNHMIWNLHLEVLMGCSLDTRFQGVSGTFLLLMTSS